MIVFSIIIPVYNLENCIKKTLESICQNHLDEVEIIVVDDGSSDNTAKIAEDYLEYKNVPNFAVLSQDNKGVSAARNAGIAVARGEYLIFVDGDDLCSADMISAISNIANEKYDIIVWRYAILCGENRKVSQQEFAKNKYTNQTALKSFLLWGNRIRIGSFAVKKTLLEERGIRYTEGCVIAEDIEFIYKSLATAKEVYTRNDILYTYKKREGSAMHRFDWKFFQAPESVHRVYDYVKDNTDVLEDKELEDYIHNGLYLLHTMFAFNSCMNYLKNLKDVRAFLQQYMDEYYEIEKELKRIGKEMKVIPSVYNRARTKLFVFSRRIYVYCVFMKASVGIVEKN